MPYPRLISSTLQKYLYYGVVALFVYMPFHIFLSQWLSTFTGGLDGWKIGKDVFTALLTAIIVLTVLITKKYTRLFLWLLGLTAVYTIIHLLVLLATDQPYDTGVLATVYNTRLFWYVLIGYGLTLINPKIVNPRKFAKLLILVSTVVCLIGLLQWIAPKDLMTHFGYSFERGARPAFFIDDKPDLPRVMSTIRDPNSLGAFLILPLCLLFYGLLKFWKTNKRTLFAGLFTLHILILFLTFSRSALLGAIISLGLVFALVNSKLIKNIFRKYTLVLIVGFALLAGLAFAMRDQYVIQNILLHSDENTRLETSNELHASNLEKGLSGIADKPLGHGPGTAGLVAIQKGGLLTENYFVQVGYEVGLIGLGLLITLMAFIVKRLWKLKDLSLPLALLASFVGLTIINMLLHTWSNEAVACS